MEDLAVSFFDTKGTTIMTNVPGPRKPLFLAGAPVGTVLAWVPQSGRVSLGFSIVSYNGKVWLGVATDAGLIPDPETIVAMFVQEYQALIRSAYQVQRERQERMQPILALLDEAMQTSGVAPAEAEDNPGA